MLTLRQSIYIVGKDCYGKYFEGGLVEDLEDRHEAISYFTSAISTTPSFQQDVLQGKWTPEDSSLDFASVGRNKHLDT